MSGEGLLHRLLTQAVTATWSQRDATAHVRVCTDGERERQTIDREREKRERATAGKNWLRQRTEQSLETQEGVNSVFRPVYDSPAEPPPAGSGQVSVF